MQITISYAFRCMPWELFLLTEGTIRHPNVPHVCVFGKKEIAPSFLDEYCILDPKKTNERLSLTSFGNEVFSKPIIMRNAYVAKVETQIEFAHSTEVLEAIHKVAMPAIEYDTSEGYFSNDVTGYLTMLRVYEIDKLIPERILEKGRKGSATIMRLYNSYGDYVSVKAKLLEPVVPKSTFDYLRDEIIHSIRSKGKLLGVYDSNESGKRLLKTLGDIRHNMQAKRSYDLSTSEDHAKFDYSSFYVKMAREFPNLRFIVSYIREVKPAQFGEIASLIVNAKSGCPQSINRLADVHFRSILRLAYKYHILYGADIEELFQEGVCGLLLAIPRYDIFNGGTTFSAYASFWVKRVMFRNIIMIHDIVYAPIHIMELVIQSKWIVFSHHCPKCKFDRCNELVLQICTLLNISEGKAQTVIDLCLPPVSACTLEQNDDSELIRHECHLDSTFSKYEVPISDDGVLIQMIESNLDHALLHNEIMQLLTNLRPKETEVIRRRFGFDSKSETLEEIGSEFGVSRERVRQIEDKALRKLAKEAIKWVSKHTDGIADILQ